VLFERYENTLHDLIHHLTQRFGREFIFPVIGDVTDAVHVNLVMDQYRPDLVFHAAAHKHVPLMEAHPCEAVKNNVGGTRLVAEAARRHGVARFILISTDKAVNPTSVMGATKRIAELVTMAHAFEGETDFLTVRFGNVLGSNGSAIPRFIEQIKRGGPVTITHRSIRRYFMLLPEAAQLVLHVAGRGRNQGVYVLDMGEQINVEEMARNLIRLSGYTPEEDIAIEYVGLRPGEKLYEELVGQAETVKPATIDRVFEVTSTDVPSADWIDRHVRKLEGYAKQGHATGVMRTLSMMIPEYTGRRWETTVRVQPAPETTSVGLEPAGVGTL